MLLCFRAQQLRLPHRGRFGEVVWKVPTLTAILGILKNPAYAGAFVYGRTRTQRVSATSRRASQQHLPMAQWRVRVNDKYPGYISWETYEQIRALLQDNYAEYDRTKSRGMPRPGTALIQGLGYCGTCGHKLVVQYKSGAHYLCNQLRQHYGVPICQYIPAEPVDAKVVEAFFAALSSLELDAYARAVSAQQQTQASAERAHAQQLQRLRYQAALAQHQFEQVDPANRLVAAELERRWESALRDVQQAEEATQHRAQAWPGPAALPAALREAFTALGQQLPGLWQTTALSRVQRKAFLRCLLDKVVIHRVGRDCVRLRIVWRGGESTTYDIPVLVGSFAALSTGRELEQRVLALHAAGKTDQEIAAELTAAGFRSPMRHQVTASTVKNLRLKHRRLSSGHQSHPRHIPGALPIPAVAARLGVSVQWLHYRIKTGRIRPQRDPAIGLSVFPDHPRTFELLTQLRDGHLQRVGFTKEYQDA